MSNRWATIVIIVLLLVFAGYIVIDVTLKEKSAPAAVQAADTSSVYDQWQVTKIFEPGKGQLNAVTVSGNGNIILGGESFIACYDSQYNLLWDMTTEMPVTAIASEGEKIFCAIRNTILMLGTDGKKIDEFGPYEENAYITSVSSNESWLAFADAANKKVFVLDKGGVVKHIIGNPEDPFILPSFYFDIALDKENNIFVANTGNRRIEKRKADGTLISYFGEAGTDKSSFCGCCNPSHFIILPDGDFVTAEKGINRIKILDRKGGFVEFISSANRFVPALPLDLASSDGITIYGANPADSKLYVFNRK